MTKDVVAKKVEKARKKVKGKGERNEIDEIDDLFNKAKSQKADKKTNSPIPKERKMSKKKDTALFGDPKGELTEGATRRFTEDGLPIYLWEEIISPGGGDSPDCPFDCQCCY